MKIRYNVTRADLVRGAIRSVLFNRPLMTYLSVFIVIMIGWMIKDQIAQKKGTGFIVFFAVFEIALIAALVIIGVAITTCLAIFFGKGRGVIGEHELEISEAGLSERTEFNDSLHRWKGVTAVKESSAFYFIRVNESGGAFHLIPKKMGRVIEGDLGSFIAEIKSRINAAQGGKAEGTMLKQSPP
jgi:hypothetical protein